jgi:hypothetical protein
MYRRQSVQLRAVAAARSSAKFDYLWMPRSTPARSTGTMPQLHAIMAYSPDDRRTRGGQRERNVDYIIADMSECYVVLELHVIVLCGARPHYVSCGTLAPDHADQKIAKSAPRDNFSRSLA